MTDFQHSTAQHISVHDRGFMLGDGVFDTALVVNGVIMHHEAHIQRLIRHATCLGIDVLHESIENVMRDALSKLTPQTLTPHTHHVLRTTITRGQTARGLWPLGALKPTIVATIEPFNVALMGQNVRLTVSTIMRNETSPTSKLKTLNYLDAILAAREAFERGYDDALMLNTQQRVACSTVGNVFIINGNEIITPPLRDGAVDGIIRGHLLKASVPHFKIAEQSLTLGNLMSAESIFLTNSLRIVRPVIQLHERTFDVCEHLKTLLLEILHFEHTGFLQN